MLKILQARLQQYMNHELPNVQAGFIKGRVTTDQIANSHWIIEKTRVPERHLLLLYWLHQSLCLCKSQQTGKFLKWWKYQKTLPASWEICMQVKKQQFEVNSRQFQIGKGVCQGCILSPCLFYLYADIYFIIFIYLEKCLAEWSTSWNQD